LSPSNRHGSRRGRLLLAKTTPPVDADNPTKLRADKVHGSSGEQLGSKEGHVSRAIHAKTTREELFQNLSERSSEDLIQLCQFLARSDTGKDKFGVRAGASRVELLAALNRATRPSLISAIDAYQREHLRASRIDAENFPGPRERAPWPEIAPGRDPATGEAKFRIYEIILHPDCVNLEGVQKQNETLLSSSRVPRGYLYVGYTAHTAEHRFWQHTRDRRIKELTKVRLVKAVYRYGLELSDVRPARATTKPDVEKEEQQHAAARRAEGFVVYSGREKPINDAVPNQTGQEHSTKGKS
jgi:hypothetical protein